MSSDRFKWLEFGDGSPRPEPSHAEATGGKDQYSHVEKADGLFRDGDYEPALRNYSAALGYDAGHAPAWCGQVRCLLRMGDLQQALVWGQKGLQRLPRSPEAHSVFALVLARAGHPGDGLQASDVALSLCAEASQPVTDRVWLERGALLLQCGQHEQAKACFDRIRLAHPGDPDWTQEIGVEQFDSGEFAVALEAFKEACAGRPDRAYLWVMVARASQKLHLDAQARVALDQARSLRPVDSRIAREEKALGERPRRPCWIATAVFHDAGHPVVQALRRWRDDRWLNRPLGRGAAALYDLTAPWVCRLLARVPALHRPIRALLTWLARAAQA